MLLLHLLLLPIYLSPFPSLLSDHLHSARCFSSLDEFATLLSPHSTTPASPVNMVRRAKKEKGKGKQKDPQPSPAATAGPSSAVLLPTPIVSNVVLTVQHSLELVKTAITASVESLLLNRINCNALLTLLLSDASNCLDSVRSLP